ncbi:hypothetical protein [Pimelobacter sp. 30-1]|uniref:hypothetical protein n=1 Tax=Pimelobacter sp. 30-1 TaxID=2004991 RepID=UPI001C053B1F|nr:hypothetical protein [Pimelobacter sp. 30-1]
MRSWVLAACVAAVGLSGCTGAPEADPDQRLSWREIERDGTGGDGRVAVFLSAYADAAEPRGFLGLVDGEGRTEFLTTETRADGLLAARDGELCASDRRWRYRITLSGGERTAHRGGDDAPVGRWAGVRPDGGGCVTIVSGASNEVLWETDGRDRRSVVPGVVGPAGLSPDALWALGAPVSGPGPQTLYRTDLATGETTEHLSWQVGSDTLTDLFWHDGRLVALDADLRLAELDPVARRADTTLLQHPAGGGPSAAPPVHGAATALRAGHLDGDTLYTADSGGEILGVDLTTRRIRVVGTLSPESAAAVDAAAAWDGDRLHLVLVGADDEVTLETYDLTTGERVERQEVDGWSSLLEDDRVLLTGAAALG